MNDGRQLYTLPGGRKLMLSPRRQAKKTIVKAEGLSSRQWKKRKKQLMREARDG